MRLSNSLFGTACLWAGILLIYGLLACKLYILHTKGVWVDWTIGNYMPDDMIRSVFSLKESLFRKAVVWLLWQDLIFFLLPFPVLIFLLDHMAER